MGPGVPDPLPCLCSQVSRHLPKLFDSLAKLKFKMSPARKPLKVGLGMFSRDEEYVPLDGDCDLSGQVSRAPCSLCLQGQRWAGSGWGRTFCLLCTNSLAAVLKCNHEAFQPKNTPKMGSALQV